MYGDRPPRKSYGFVGFIVLAIILGILVFYLKSDGHSLGDIKNRFLNTPTQSKAKMEAGQAQMVQQNKNIADKELAKRNSDFAKGEVNDPVLLKDQFSVTTDMYGFDPVHAIFVFSNDQKLDKPWIDSIKKARKEGITVATINGNELPENDDTFLYNYYNRNYDMRKNMPDYGHKDGKHHPFITAFINGEPKEIVIKSENADDMFKELKKAKLKSDKKANNYDLPDNGSGVPYPDYGKAIEQGKRYYESYVKEHAKS